jgi:hypothetical protein
MKILKHILLQSARAYPRSGALSPDGWRYDTKVGAWISPITGRFMVHEPTSSGCGTKKADLETGEDAKGE